MFPSLVLENILRSLGEILFLMRSDTFKYIMYLSKLQLHRGEEITMEKLKQRFRIR